MPTGQYRGGRCEADPFADLVEQFERSLTGTVPLVDDGDDRNAAVTTHLKQLERLRFEALGSVDEHDRRVDGGQDAVRVLGEVGVTGGVSTRLMTLICSSGGVSDEW